MAGSGRAKGGHAGWGSVSNRACLGMEGRKLLLRAVKAPVGIAQALALPAVSVRPPQSRSRVPATAPRPRLVSCGHKHRRVSGPAFCGCRVFRTTGGLGLLLVCPRSVPVRAAMKKAPADGVRRGFEGALKGLCERLLFRGVAAPAAVSHHFLSLAIESCRAFSGSSVAGAAVSLPGAAAAPSMPAVGSAASDASPGMVASISMRTLSRS